MTDQNFDTALENFLAGAQKTYDEHQARWYPNAERSIDVTIEVDGGQKFLRIARVERYKEDGNGYKAGDILTRSAYAFIAKEGGSNKKLGLWQVGDVFKCDGWKGPAKGVRGNLFDQAGGLGRAGEYSVR